MDEFMLPNDGEYFLPHEPEERTRRREVAKSKAYAAKDTLTEVISRLDQRIDFYDHLSNIPDDALVDEELFRIHIAANKQTVANLQLERDYWKGVLKDTH